MRVKAPKKKNERKKGYFSRKESCAEHPGNRGPYCVQGMASIPTREGPMSVPVVKATLK